MRPCPCLWRLARVTVLIGGMYGCPWAGPSLAKACFQARNRRIEDGAGLGGRSRLRRCGFTLFDTQFMTPHLASLGAVSRSRALYRAQLARALEIARGHSTRCSWKATLRPWCSGSPRRHSGDDPARSAPGLRPTIHPSNSTVSRHADRGSSARHSLRRSDCLRDSGIRPE